MYTRFDPITDINYWENEYFRKPVFKFEGPKYIYEPYCDKEELRKYVHKYLSKYCTSNKSTGMDIWTKRLLNITGVIIASLFIYLVLNILTTSLFIIYDLIIEAVELEDSMFIFLNIYTMSVIYLTVLLLNWMCHDCVTKYIKTIPSCVERIIFFLARIPIVNIYTIFVYLIIFIYEYVRAEIVPLFKKQIKI